MTKCAPIPHTQCRYNHFSLWESISLKSVIQFLKIMNDSQTTSFVLFSKKQTNRNYYDLLFRNRGWSKVVQLFLGDNDQHNFFLTGLFSGICGHILKNYKWFINYILCPNQQNKPEISINLGLGTWGDQSCTHSSQTTATIITWIFRLRGLFSGTFGTIFNNYRWFINYFFCSIQQKNPEISTIFASGAGSYQSCSYSAQT